jgi:hypothetical protein
LGLISTAKIQAIGPDTETLENVSLLSLLKIIIVVSKGEEYLIYKGKFV